MGMFSLDSPGGASDTENRLNVKYEVIVNCNKEETKQKGLEKPRASIDFAAFENINIDAIDELFTKKSINRISQKRVTFLRNLEVSKDQGNPISKKIWENLHGEEKPKKNSMRKKGPKMNRSDSIKE